jgi:hypothetical protein
MVSPLSHPSAQTPMERIFEKVMLRKMTEAEKDILGLNLPAEPRTKRSKGKSGVSRKKGPHLTESDSAN